MHIKSNYVGELRTEALHVQSGNKIITDAPTDNQGKGQAFSPTDLVAGALASCMMTIMGIEANKLGFDCMGLKSDTKKLMKVSPRAIAKIVIVFDWDDCQLNSEIREFLKQKALECPVALSLHPDIRQDITFNF